MRSQGRANRRSRGGKGQDADQFSTFREEIHSETYSRSQQISHRDESLRLSPSPQRNSFEGTGDASSSRRSRDGDWRHSGSGHERYSYDVYHRNERDEYEIPASKDPDGWHGSDTHHSQSRSEWSQRHDHGNQTSSYPGASSWTSTPNSYQGGKSSYHGQWQSSETRNSAQGSRQQDTGPEDRYPVKDSSGWRGGRQEKGNRRFPRDSRWNSRRKDKLPDEGVRWEEPNERGPVEERAWEPAAAWKSSERENTPRRRGQNGQAQYQRNAKGGRRNLNANKQKRDWRSDDGSLNNWTRRDSHLYNNTKRSEIPNSFRKHPRSPSHSPSRSRSPAESYRSHRSSRARTRSPSISPPSKRRRRTSRNHSPAPRGRTPLEKDGSHWISNHRNDKDYSRSPSPYGSSDSFYARRRSSSSGSSVSTDRSVSKSPRDRPRAVHRLPTMNSDIPNTSRISRNIPARNTGFYRDDKIQVRNRRNDFGRRTDYNPKFASTEPTSMLPPSSIPSPRNIKKQPLIQDTVLEDTHSVVYTSNNTQRTRIVPSKATSKRLGKTSSSLKKFFPGDEDDLDLVAEEKQSVTSDIAYGAYPQPTTTSMPPPERTEFEPQDYNFTESHPSNQPRHGERRTLPGWRGEGELYYRDRASNGSQMKRPLFSLAVPKGLPHDNSPGSQGILSRLTELEDNRGDISPSATRNDETQSDLQDVTLFQPRSDAHEDTEAEIGSVDHGHSRGATAKELYTIISQVGEGTFGKVYKARNIITNVNVALKRIRMESEKDGFPVTAMREIKLLQSLRHENVVRLYEMMVSNGSVYMVFEYMDHDLTGVLSQTQFNFNQANLKSLCLQMLAGLAYLHHKGVIHRDIKGSNILINNRGELKLADFGLARFYQKRRRSDYTNRVITLWYRPPELLFGATIYGPEVDMWSAGCIMLELFTKKPVFQGNDEIHQLEVVYKIIGTPSPERWAGVMNLPWYELVKPREVIVNRFRELFQKWMSPAALDLAENLLAYDPTQRITASQAMLTHYFTQEDPPPAAPVGLATLEGEWHELETKRERARKRRRAEIVP